MKSEVKRRIGAAIPRREQLIPLLGSLAIPVLLKVPLATAVGLTTLWAIDRFREEPGLVPAAMTVYAINILLTSGLDYSVLRDTGVSASPKVNLIYRLLTLVRPERESNKVLAEAVNVVANVFGVGLDPSAHISTGLSLVSGDLTYVAAQRVSAMVWGLATETSYAVGLKLNAHRRR